MVVRFNRTNENIEWARWSWNPVTGCRHGCDYCYARDIANRFYTTVDQQARVAVAEEVFSKLEATIKFVSCEPLLEPVTFSSISHVDWIIVGGGSRSSRTPETQPLWSWVEHLLTQARGVGAEVYFKPNLTVRPREYPKT